MISSSFEKVGLLNSPEIYWALPGEVHQNSGYRVEVLLIQYHRTHSDDTRDLGNGTSDPCTPASLVYSTPDGLIWVQVDNISLPNHVESFICS